MFNPQAPATEFGRRTPTKIYNQHTYTAVTFEPFKMLKLIFFAHDVRINFPYVYIPVYIT